MQWRVDDDGDLIAMRPYYLIAKDRLTEPTTRNGVKYYDFPIHLAEKEWVDLVEFERAWLWAVYLSGLKFDIEMARASFRWARGEREEYGIPISGVPLPE